MRQGEVYIHNKKAGVLTETDAPRGYEFCYDTEYLLDTANEPVCLAMPLSDKIYRSTHLFPYFANMLSEGENRKIQASMLHMDADDDFGILLETAAFDTVGAITIRKIR